MSTKEYRRKQRAERKGMVRAARNDVCADCGLWYPWWIMEFDHCRGVKKYHFTGAGLSSKKRIIEELAKCDLVCANCHRDREYHRRVKNG